MNTLHSNKIWTRDFILLFCVSLFSNLGLNMSNAMISVYADHLGGTAVQVGMVFSSFAVASLAFRVILGPISDVYNRKIVIFVFSVISAVAFWGYSFSNSIATLVIFRMLQGIGTCGVATTIILVADILPPDSYGAGVGYFSLAMVISNAIGPATGIWLSETVGYRTSFMVFAVLVTLNLILISQVRVKFKRTRTLTIRLKHIVAKEVFVPSLMLFLTTAGLHMATSYLVLYATSLGLSVGFSLYYIVMALVALVVRPLLGKLSDKYGMMPVVLPALCFHLIGCLVMSFATSLVHILLAAVINAIGSAACQPAFQAISMKKVGTERRGVVNSTNMMGIDLAALIVPSIGGAIVQSLGYRSLFRFQMIPYALCGLVIILGRSWILNTEREFREAHAGEQS